MPDGQGSAEAAASANAEASQSVAEADEASFKPERKGVFGRLRQLLGGPETNGSIAEALQKSDASIEGLSQSRKEMIERVIAFDDKQVSDVMLPRADIVAIEQSITLTELLKAFSDAGHSRLPVYRGDLDDPVGMVHIRDLVGILADPEQGEAEPGEALGNQEILSRLMRKLLYVPPSMAVTDLLLRMQASRIHMALVIDEFGGTDGLVTIEDLIEEIVGEIHDEHDEEDDISLRAVAADCWEAKARVPLELVEEELGIKLEQEGDEVDTLGGLVFTLAGRVPVRGEVLNHPVGLEFEVMDADPRRIRKIKMKLLRSSDLIGATSAAPAEISK